MPDPHTDTEAPAGSEVAPRPAPPERTTGPGGTLPDESVTNEPVPAGKAADGGLSEGEGPGFDIEEAAAYRENDA